MRATTAQHASAIHLPAMQQGLTQVGPFVVMGHEVHPFWNGTHVGPLLACSVCVTFIPKPIAIPNVLSVLDSNWMSALIRSKFK